MKTGLLMRDTDAEIALLHPHCHRPALRRAGYHGNLDIDGHHDSEYHGNREEEGLRVAVKTIRDAIAKNTNTIRIDPWLRIFPY